MWMRMVRVLRDHGNERAAYLFLSLQSPCCRRFERTEETTQALGTPNVDLNWFHLLRH